MQIGNQLFRGRYLFAGSNTVVQPFVETQAGIVYQGDQRTISSYSDINALFNTNVTGDAAFGGFSQQVQGFSDLNPVLTAATPLSQLNGGKGVNLGSLQVSDGTNSKTIDLSTAKTVGDVVKLLDANPPAGRTLTTEITPTGLTLQLDAAGGGNLVVEGFLGEGQSQGAERLGALGRGGHGSDHGLQVLLRLGIGFVDRGQRLLDAVLEGGARGDGELFDGRLGRFSSGH